MDYFKLRAPENDASTHRLATIAKSVKLIKRRSVSVASRTLIDRGELKFYMMINQRTLSYETRYLLSAEGSYNSQSFEDATSAPGNSNRLSVVLSIQHQTITWSSRLALEALLTSLNDHSGLRLLIFKYKPQDMITILLHCTISGDTNIQSSVTPQLQPSSDREVVTSKVTFDLAQLRTLCLITLRSAGPQHDQHHLDSSDREIVKVTYTQLNLAPSRTLYYAAQHDQHDLSS